MRADAMRGDLRAAALVEMVATEAHVLRPSAERAGQRVARLDRCCWAPYIWDSSERPSLPKSWYAEAPRTQMPVGAGGGRSQFWLVSSIRKLSRRGGPPLTGSDEDACLEMVARPFHVELHRLRLDPDSVGHGLVG